MTIFVCEFPGSDRTFVVKLSKSEESLGSKINALHAILPSLTRNQTQIL